MHYWIGVCWVDIGNNNGQQAFKPIDSNTLRVIVPLKGKPKEPYRCVIAAKKGKEMRQVSKSITFPPTFK